MTTFRKYLRRPSALIVIASCLVLLLAVQIARLLPATLAQPSTTVAHWSWIYRPQSLRELYELSDLIVVATVGGVSEGPEWAGTTTSPDYPVVRADSMLIDITVVTPIKGAHSAGAVLTLYRQGNLRDNTHQEGDTYLFFLHELVEREGSAKPAAGSHFVFAAEGNHHIVDGRLIWDWAHLANDTNSFAATELDNAPLADVVQRLELLRTSQP